MILDIRKEQKEEITGIKFDDEADYISWSGSFLSYHPNGVDDERINLCRLKDVDNFVAALYKAKELAGK